jgi:hypothetical protein
MRIWGIIPCPCEKARLHHRSFNLFEHQVFILEPPRMFAVGANTCVFQAISCIQTLHSLTAAGQTATVHTVHSISCNVFIK